MGKRFHPATGWVLTGLVKAVLIQVGSLFLTGLVCMVGCAVPTPREAPAIDLAEPFAPAGSNEMPAEWWLLFADPRLDGYIADALGQNLSLNAARSRIDQARATMRREGAVLYPGLDTTGGIGFDVAPTGQDGLRGSLTVSASYEIDLWGRIGAGQDALTLDTLARSADLQAMAMALTAEIASVWYGLVESRGQLQLLDQQRQANANVLQLVELRFELGHVGAQDVLRQRQLLEARAGERLQLLSNIAVLEHRLAILLGKAPQGFSAADSDTLPPLPDLPATGLPADVLLQRPDVRAAFLRLQAADLRVAAAVADRYPRLSLSASIGTSSQAGDIFTDWLGTLAMNLFSPIFEGGRRAAEVDRAAAVAEEVFNEYGQRILVALGEVEDALARDSYQSEIVESLKVQVALAEEVVQRSRGSYERGGVAFVTVLEALTSHQALERSLLTAERTQLQHRIDLCRALGGTWDVPPTMIER